MIWMILLLLVGVAVLVTAVQWQRGEWRASALWVARNVSLPFVVAAPAGGAMFASLGVSVMFPGAVILALAAAVGFMAALIAGARDPLRYAPAALRTKRGAAPQPGGRQPAQTTRIREEDRGEERRRAG
jgi:hypothetical protein